MIVQAENQLNTYVNVSYIDPSQYRIKVIIEKVEKIAPVLKNTGSNVDQYA